MRNGTHLPLQRFDLFVHQPLHRIKFFFHFLHVTNELALLLPHLLFRLLQLLNLHK
jgi:hypothetical protein